MYTCAKPITKTQAAIGPPMPPSVRRQFGAAASRSSATNPKTLPLVDESIMTQSDNNIMLAARIPAKPKRSQATNTTLIHFYCHSHCRVRFTIIRASTMGLRARRARRSPSATGSEAHRTGESTLHPALREFRRSTRRLALGGDRAGPLGLACANQSRSNKRLQITGRNGMATKPVGRMSRAAASESHRTPNLGHSQQRDADPRLRGLFRL